MAKSKTRTGPEFEGKIELTQIRKIKISDLIEDDRNANRGTDLGNELLETSLDRFGVGRGVLADKNLKLIAGNHAARKMREMGITDVVLVPTDGKTLVVTQRIDIEKDSKEGHGLALADNRVTQANLNFDIDTIRDLDAEFDLDLADLAINIHEDGPHFPGGMSEPDASEAMETDFNRDRDNSVYQPSSEKGYEQSFFPLAIALSKAERVAFDAWKKNKKVHTDTEAFQLMFNTVKNL